MDLLQAALIFLILLLSIFLAITGFWVFLILADLKKALDRLNKVLQVEQDSAAANLMSSLSTKAKLLGGKHKSEHKQKRFYKRSL